jgi:hypothetical protein
LTKETVENILIVGLWFKLLSGKIESRPRHEKGKTDYEDL